MEPVTHLPPGTLFHDPFCQPQEVYVMVTVVAPKGGGAITDVYVRNVGCIRDGYVQLYTDDRGLTSYNTCADVQPLRARVEQ